MTMNTIHPMTFSARTTLAVLREIVRPGRGSAVDGADAARRLPDFPATGRGGYTVSLLGQDPRHVA